MKTKLYNLWESLRSSFWLIPMLLVLTAITLSFNTVSFDKIFDFGSQHFYGLFYAVSPEGARSILTTVAGSMMTVAGVTFSITIVVLNLASSQFGPRLLRNFMQDKSTQFVLGTFVATFIYCLLILRAVQTGGSGVFVPNMSIAVAVVLALFNVGVLIFFIHHVSTAIQADAVIAKLSKSVEQNIERIFPRMIEEEGVNISEKPLPEEENKEHYYSHNITSLCNGYLQAVDFDKILQAAQDSESFIHIKIRPGQFVVADGTLATVRSREIFEVELTGVIRDQFIIGDQGTAEQDAEYAIHQLVEVAIRALSPGINDPYTAISCIDQLGSSLCFLAKRAFPPSHCFDEEGRLCMEIKPFTFKGMVNASFDQIRQFGRSSVAVTIRLIETLITIAEQSRSQEQRKAVYRQAEMVLIASQESLQEQNDRDDVMARYKMLLNTLHSFGDPEGEYELPQ